MLEKRHQNSKEGSELHKHWSLAKAKIKLEEPHFSINLYTNNTAWSRINSGNRDATISLKITTSKSAMQHTRCSRDLSIRSAAWGRARISRIASQGSDEEAEKDKRCRQPCWWGRGRLGLSGENKRRGKERKIESKEGVSWGALRLWVQINGSRCISAARYWTELSQARTRSNPDRARASRFFFSLGQVRASREPFCQSWWCLFFLCWMLRNIYQI